MIFYVGYFNITLAMLAHFTLANNEVVCLIHCLGVCSNTLPMSQDTY